MMGEQAAETKKTETSLPEGKIVQVSGPVVDVKFESGPLPEIRDALTVENQGKTCVMEAAKHITGPGFPWWAVWLGLTVILLATYIWRVGYPPKKSRSKE